MGEKGQPLGYTADQWTQPHVTYQPGSSSVQVKGEKDGITWVPRPTSIPPNCPPGLEYLTTIDQLLVEQKVRLMEGKIYATRAESGCLYTLVLLRFSVCRCARQSKVSSGSST